MSSMSHATAVDSEFSWISKSKIDAVAFHTTMTSPTLSHSVSAGDDLNTPPTPPYLSDVESRFYYSGLPSKPALIARTGSALWEVPTGPETYPREKELGVVGRHAINDMWRVLAPKVRDILNKAQVEWTSIDVVRIGYVDEHPAPVVLWIGIYPGSQVTYTVNYETAVQCKDLLLQHDINDVEVEMRHSEVIRCAGPQLFQPAYNSDPTASHRQPFTSTLGIPICAKDTPWYEGTTGFFLDEYVDGGRLLLVTARHVVLPGSDNEAYEHRCEQDCKSAHRDVLILSDPSFHQHLASITGEIDEQRDIKKLLTKRIGRMVGRRDDGAVREEQDAIYAIRKAEEKETALTDLHHELSTQWAPSDNRVVGHVVFSPPIAAGIGAERYTRDIAVIVTDASKIDPASFAGNAIDLGFKFPPQKLAKMVNTDPEDPEQFEFPDDRLLRLRGTITEEEMRKPTTYDTNGEPGIMVLKLGKATDLTVGRASTVFSVTRPYFGPSQKGLGESMEWAILPFDKKSGAFSARGDSGSVVVDGAGRIGGLLTGGSGTTDSTDMTYVTPISFVMDTIRSCEFLANANIKSGLSA